MRSLSTLVFVLACGALVCFATPASATVIFQDDFESHTGRTTNVGDALTSIAPLVGDNYNLSGGAIADATTDPPGSAAGGTKFAATATGAADYMNISAANQAATAGQVITFNADAYVTSGTGTTILLALQTASDWTNLLWQVGLQGDGGVKYYANGLDWVSIGAAGTISTDEWIPVKVVGDFTAHTYDLTVDGHTFSDLPFGSTASSVGQIYVAGAGQLAYYDNVSMGTVPEPSAMLLTATGLLGLLAYAWRKRR